MHAARISAPSTALFVAGYALSCASGRSVPALVALRATIAAGQTPSSLYTGFSPSMKLMHWRANPDEADHRLESRVRENRMHGSEGGEGFGPSRPLSTNRCSRRPTPYSAERMPNVRNGSICVIRQSSVTFRSFGLARHCLPGQVQVITSQIHTGRRAKYV